MKRILCFLLVITLSCSVVDAQGLLRSLGRAIGETVAGEINKAIVKEIRNNKKKGSKQSNSPMQEQTANTSVQAGSDGQETPAQSGSARTTHVKPQNMAVADSGQNIPRESGLDYIDEWGINHGGGILIDSVLWAPVNCGYHATDYPYGKLYQWGRKHGQGYGAPYMSERNMINPDAKTAEITPAPVTPAQALKYPNRFYARSDYSLFNWTENDTNLWNSTSDNCIISRSEYDPCPEGWRLPDLFDFYCLAQNYSGFVEHNGQKGRWLTGSKPYSVNVPRIFLPYAGSRDRNGLAYRRHACGLYWSGRHTGSEGMIWHLYMYDSGVDVDPSAYPHEAFSVRCVKDVKGQITR